MNWLNKNYNQLTKLFRYLPAFKGKKRIARLFLPNKYLSKVNRMISGKYNIVYSTPNCVESIGFDLLVDGIYEKQTIDFLIKKIPERGLLLDIGSNIGSIGLPVAKLRKDTTVFCIEASKLICDYLNRNIDLNKLRNIEAFNFAFSDQNIDSVPFFSPLDKFGKGSFSSLFTSNAEQVLTKTIDTFLDELQLSTVDFIKMDVEGYEYSVIKGAEKLLTGNDAPDMLFEFVDWAEAQAYSGNTGMAQELLKFYGYKLYQINGNGEIEFMSQTLNRGAAMIFATKKINENV